MDVFCESFSYHNGMTDTAIRFVSSFEVQQGTLDEVFWRQSCHVGCLISCHSGGDPEWRHRLKRREGTMGDWQLSEGGGGGT